jgi:hypothetical protein
LEETDCSLAIKARERKVTRRTGGEKRAELRKRKKKQNRGGDCTEGSKICAPVSSKRNRGVRRHSLVSQRRPQGRKQVTQGAPPSPLTTELTDEEEKAEDAGDGDWRETKQTRKVTDTKNQKDS